MIQRFRTTFNWLTTTWLGFLALCYWFVAVAVGASISLWLGTQLNRWWEWNWYTPTPWWFYIIPFAVIVLAFAVLWTIITLKNLGTTVPDSEVSLIVQPRLSLRFLKYLFLPLRLLLRLPYQGAKGFRDIALRTCILIFVLYLALWFFSSSPQGREGLATIWSFVWPLLVTAFLGYGLIDFGIYQRGTGILVKTDGTVLAVQMKFWWIFLAPQIVELSSSQIDVRSFRSVIIPFLPQVALWSGFSLKNEVGDAVVIQGLGLADVKDRVASASAAGRRGATAAGKVLEELALAAARTAQQQAQAAQPTP